MEKGQHIRLAGKTRHGKNRIHQHGDIWEIDNVGRFSGMPAIGLRSMNATEGPRDHKIRDGRWVLISNDPNFEWEIVE
tara:strand:- start:324 stop:557 length:234 start_codon:yes stop_codon:yes gene_type:complete